MKIDLKRLFISFLCMGVFSTVAYVLIPPILLLMLPFIPGFELPTTSLVNSDEWCLLDGVWLDNTYGFPFYFYYLLGRSSCSMKLTVNVVALLVDLSIFYAILGLFGKFKNKSAKLAK